MKSIKKIIIFLLILVILLLMVLIVIKVLNDSSEEYPELDANSGPQDTTIELNEYTEQELDDNKVFTISRYINQLLQYENEVNSVAVESIMENYSEIENLNLKGKQSKYYIQEMYRRENLNKATYYIRGIMNIIDDEENLQFIYFIVYVDYDNATFKVDVISQEEYNTYIADTTTPVENFTIQKNEYNSFEQQSYRTQDICFNYIEDYIIKLKYNRELAYEFLDNEYRIQKFNDDFNNFNSYIDNNQDRIYSITIESYASEILDDSIEYSILDTNGNYYIVNSKGGLNYTIQLDNYTVESEEFIDLYEQSTEQEKVTTNISKLISWINEKNYLQVYNKLDNEFRQNNFPTLETFEEYINNNFFDNGIMTIENIEKISDYYICDVSIASGYGVSSEEKTFNFIMQLLEGTDFVMSFNV